MFDFEPSELESMISGFRAVVKNIEKMQDPNTGCSTSASEAGNDRSASTRPLSDLMSLQKCRDKVLGMRPEFKRKGSEIKEAFHRSLKFF